MDEILYAAEPVTRIDAKGNVNMEHIEQRIKELDAEIESYRNAIADAEAALDSAEQELDLALSEVR